MGKKAWWYVAYCLNWAIIIWFWWSGSGSLLGQGTIPALVALGRLAGLAAAFLILVQFFFMGRTPALERVFGLDKLARIHHTSGQWGFVLLVLHPILITLSYSRLEGNSFFGQLLSFIAAGDELLQAALAVLLFTLVVGLSLYIVRRRLRYESWYYVHLLAYLAVFFAYGHQFELGNDLNASQLFYGYWVLLYVAVFASHVCFRFLRPLYRSWRHAFAISRIVRENYNTISVYLSGRNLDRFPIQPGQFMILRFLTKNLWWQAHPFSLSRLPDGRELRVTIKELGDFTRQVAGLAVGTKLIIDGPYGVFTDLFSVSPRVLFIAGGIGITPVRSLMEQMVREGKDATLLYSNRTEKDIVFKNELNQLSAAYHAPVTHVLSDAEGQLDGEKIQRLVPDVASREIFLCGPPPMMAALIAALQKLGVPMGKIHFERFSLP